jgi:hypothetical protein
VEHAKRELELSGQWAEDYAYCAALVAAIDAFASYGHSGGSAHVALEQLDRLLRFETLSPLTTDPGEWEDRSEISGRPWWQNKRDPRAMSHDGGKTWWFVEARHAGEALANGLVAQPCSACHGKGLEFAQRTGDVQG